MATKKNQTRAKVPQRTKSQNAAREIEPEKPDGRPKMLALSLMQQAAVRRGLESVLNNAKPGEFELAEELIAALDGDAAEDVEPEVDDAHIILSFLIATCPLVGVDYSNDERLKLGESLIISYATSFLLPNDLFHAKSPTEKLGIAAAVIYYVHNIQPREGGSHEDYHTGVCHLLMWAEDLIVEAGGLKV